MHPPPKAMFSKSYHKLPCWCFVEKVPIKPRVMNFKLIQLSSKYPIVSASCIHGFPFIKWHLSEQRHSSLVLSQTPKPSVSS